MNTLSLSRAEHDQLIDTNPTMLRNLFARYTRNWNLRGVTFYAVPDEVIEQVRAALQPDHMLPL